MRRHELVEKKNEKYGLALHGQAVEGTYSSLEELLKIKGYKNLKDLEDAGWEVIKK